MEILDLAIEVTRIAQEAGKAIMGIYGQDDFNVETKEDDSPLTIADKKANAIICDGLEKLSVNYPIISEENKAVPYEVRSQYDYYWLVDPLDGTKEFIKRNGEFTVNIALVKQHNVVLGVVYAPVLDEMYYAAEGKGAFLVKGEQTTSLEASTFTSKDTGLKIVCSRSHLNEATQTFVNQFSDPELVPKGSSLKFLLVAQGKADLYPRLGPTMEWDTGAAQIILEEAGGKVIMETSNLPLEYNKENLLNPNFIALGNQVQ